MEDARAVIDRLRRIDELRDADAAPQALLAELRALLDEAEEWARAEGGEAGDEAVGKLRTALARDMIGV
jgi:ElaB/YqjD/DUF883 family membrane-anchored ribosome-binding protein